MKSIERRIANIEDKLHAANNQPSMLVILKRVDSNRLPEPIEEWITYKEARANCGALGVFVADPAKELVARENLSRAELDSEG